MIKNIPKSLWVFSLYITGLILVIMNFSVVINVISALLSVLSPLFIGIAIAFVLKGPQKFIFKLLKKIKKEKIRQATSVILTYLMMTLVITLILWAIVPRLVESVQQLADNMTSYMANLESLFNDFITFMGLDNFSFQQIEEIIKSLPDEITGFMKGVFPEVFDFTTGLIVSLMNSILGLILSIYILLDLKRIKTQSERIAKYLLEPKTYKKVTEIGRVIDTSFTNFIKGQSTEVLILGVLCLIGMMIFGFSYPLLISVIIAVTSFIPIVGPIIGLIPSAFLLLMINPMEAVYFLIFILVLQQIEGNLIYPKVVGENVGLPPMFVLLAIIIGGGLFGILGMLLGVPLTSALFTLTQKKLDTKKATSAK